jgi:hypothetical protein
MVDQLAVVAFERFYKDGLKAAGECPERCLFSRHQHRVDLACVLPAVEQLKQHKGLV